MAYDKVVDSGKLDSAMSATADAIRGKTGGAESITWDESTGFADAVDGIEVGERISVQQKDVNFYDYDGTRLYSYTVAEAQALTELPPLPTRKGLICQGWNWTLADIQAVPMACDVGAMYITDDGATRLYISIWSELQKHVYVRFNQSVAYGAVVDWGDGSDAESKGIANSRTFEHTYETNGNYVITITPQDGGDIALGHGALAAPLFGIGSASAGAAAKMSLKRVEIGRIAGITQATFNHCVGLECVNIPDGVTGILNNTFNHCNSLKYVVLPASYREAVGAGMPNLFLAQGISVPEGVEEYTTSYFYGNKSTDTIIVPASVKSIQTTAFSGSDSLRRFVFRCATPPTVANSNAFGSIHTTCIVEVPAESLEAYKNATNYGTIAAQMVGV